MGVPSYPKNIGINGHAYLYSVCREIYLRAVKRVCAGDRKAGVCANTFVYEHRTRYQAEKGKLYLDFLQTAPRRPLLHPIQWEAKAGATVSAPLSWDEVKPGLKMKDFNIFTMTERLQTKGDLFKPVLGKGINMNAALKKLSALVEQEEE